ncbi:MAG TPA: YdeI/OmpD-associated family protein [Acidimicrobiales bacterium]|nr:YdeI/OmpD-associated family protein [Acidimicrobiales bacterium]
MEHFDDVDQYLERSEQWPAEVAALREVLLGCGLTEVIKWGKPCYVHDGRNIALVQEFKDFLALMFFKGALLDDPDGVLEAQGPNSRSARRMCFTSVDDVTRSAGTIEAYVAAAIEVEESGAEVGPPPELDLVDELRERLDRDPALKEAFEALTPGRQRAYNLHVAGAKRSETRVARIEKHVPRILQGKGPNDR